MNLERERVQEAHTSRQEDAGEESNFYISCKPSLVLHASCLINCGHLQQLLDTLDVLAPTCAVLTPYTQTTLTPCKDLSVDDSPCAAVQNGAPCTAGCVDTLNQVTIMPLMDTSCQDCATKTCRMSAQ